MSLDLTQADSALKEFYLPAVRNQLNNDTPMLNIIGKRTVDVEGRRAVLSLLTGRNSGVGSRADGGTLPSAGAQSYSEERVPLKYHYGVIEVSGPAIAQMKSNAGSFVRAVDSEMKGVTNDIKRDQNRQLWGTSDGIIASCDTTSASTTLNLNNDTPDSTMLQFFEGMHIDLGTLSEMAAQSGGPGLDQTVDAVDVTNKTLTLAAAVTTDTSDKVAVQGNAGSVATPTAKENEGLQFIVDDAGTLHNVNPSTVTTWKAQFDDNSGTQRAISDNLLAKMVQTNQIISGEWITHLISSPGAHRAYSALLQAQKRYPGTRELPGGYTAIDFAAAGPIIPFTYDRDCPSGTSVGGGSGLGGNVFGLNVKHLFLGAASDWDWMDKDGAVLSRVANKDAYSATLYKYCEQFTDKRNAHFRINDITEA